MNFSTANGVARSHLAAFSAADGSLLGWAPTADDSVKTMALTPDGSRVIVGGVFLNINGSPAAGLGALDATTGTLLPWAATNLIKEGGSASGVSGLYTDGTAMYGTTWAFGSPITTLSGMFSADPDSGNLNWIEDCWGDEYGVFAVNGAAYQVGHSHNCSTVNGFPNTNPETHQRSIALHGAGDRHPRARHRQPRLAQLRLLRSARPLHHQLVARPRHRHLHRSEPGPVVD